MIPIDPPAIVQVNEQRRYVAVSVSACELLGYTREELLRMHIDDLACPSAAHVPPIYENFVSAGRMEGIFAMKRKNGEAILIKFEAEIRDGHPVAVWTHYEPLTYVAALEV